MKSPEMEKKFFHCARCLLMQQAGRGSVENVGFFSTTVVARKKKDTHYEVLKLDPEASSQEIRTAFIKLSKEVHPDMNPNDPTNHSKFVQLNEAYTILSKPYTRREYDFSLAHRLYTADNLARHAYGSHGSGNSYTPGSGTAREQGFEAQERAFWDETIWYMRDKSRDHDAFYSESSYYGIKGIKKVPNSYIVAMCVAFMVLGTVSFWLCFRYSYKKSRQYTDLQEEKNRSMYKRIRENALKHTTSEQLNMMFKDREMNTPISSASAKAADTKK